MKGGNYWKTLGVLAIIMVALAVVYTTMGQELMDLDESRKKGLISDKEYERAKKDILKRYD